MLYHGLVLTGRDIFNYVPVRMEVMMEAGGSHNELRFRLKNLPSLLNGWLDRGGVFNQILIKILTVKKHIEYARLESKCTSQMQRP